MQLETTLSEETKRRVEEIGDADILVGIPSYKNAGTIGHVVKMAAKGMAEYFPEMKAVVVNSDGSSPDGTHEVVLSTPVPEGVEVIATFHQGPPGKGRAHRTTLEIARALGVKACVVVDSDLRSITPEWIELMAGPIVRKGYDYVTPYYNRDKYDATITNNVCFPMTRMLYGLEVRQPIGGDYGLSGRLVNALSEKDVWDTAVADFGIDIWMTTTAINEGFKVGQTRLGAKIHDPKDPAAALGPMFVQVVGTLFSMMTLYEEKWKGVKEVHPAPIFGDKVAEPEPVTVTLMTLIDALRAGYEERNVLWQEILSAENLAAVGEIAGLSYEDYDFPAELWARVVFDFAVAYNRRGKARSLSTPPDKVILAMTPLYYGRAGGLVKQTAEMSNPEAEEVIQAQARTFERLKPYLVEKWG